MACWYVMAGGAFWSLVKREGRAVAVTRAVVVDGGLSPPPSKIYPGTKCFMVIVAVDNQEYSGFGPSPSIAQRAAILEAYRSLRSCKSGEAMTSSKSLGSDTESEEEETVMSAETTHPSRDGYSSVHCGEGVLDSMSSPHRGKDTS